MITLQSSPSSHTFHVANRDGSAALCRSNIVPHSWVVRDSFDGGARTSFALYSLSGDSFERSCDYRRVSCLSCQRKLAGLVVGAFVEASRVDAARVVVVPVSAPVVPVVDVPVPAPAVVDVTVGVRPVFIEIGPHSRAVLSQGCWNPDGSPLVVADGPLRVLGSRGWGAGASLFVVDVAGQVWWLSGFMLRSRWDVFSSILPV